MRKQFCLGIAGYYDRYPRIPYGRACGYNEREPEKFEMSYPYLRKLNEVFKKELPVRWAAQRACANKLDPKFLIDETVFTTLTVNYNWRTAGHRDAGGLVVWLLEYFWRWAWLERFRLYSPRMESRHQSTTRRSVARQ